MQLVLLIALCGTVAFARPAINGQGFFAPLPPSLLPPGFEILPQDAIDKLTAAHNDASLSVEERRDRIESVFDELPRDILEKLPLPPGLARLPSDIQTPFKALHVDRTMGWRERQTRVHELIKQLPEDMQRLVHPPAPVPPFGSQGFRPMPYGFPSRPPPGFEFVLSPTIYKQLLAVHENTKITDDEKKQQLDKILRLVPQDQLDRLPLPPGFDQLPAETLQRMKQIMHDFSLKWDDRFQKVAEFVRSLPREERRLLRPRLPGFEALPEETRDQIDDLFENHKLNPIERNQKIHDILESLPEEIRSHIPPPPPVLPFFPKAQQEQPQNDDLPVKEQSSRFA
ncbi:hypothetical protein M3Y95_00170000 [Aphelenchoides besseyi]|nr:hypothetical protein M3Y95_00170000 [Aphelenchoides besseyi]